MRTSRIFTSLFMLTAFSWGVAACTAQESQTGSAEAAAETGGEAGTSDEGAEGAGAVEGIQATVVTSKGEIKLRLAEEDAPITVLNFVNLAERGYYNGLNFHRVIGDFMIQGGCPEGTGSGGPGYKFDNEISPKLRHDGPGVLAMANAGPNTNGSQFYITHKNTAYLDGDYNVFGRVVGEKDQVVVNAIRQGDKIVTIKIAGDTSELKAANKAQLDEWNAILDRKYPKK